jgi:hypothetical protein
VFTRNHASAPTTEPFSPPAFEPQGQPTVRPRYLPDGRGVLLFVVRPAAPEPGAPEMHELPEAKPREDSGFERFLYAITSVALEAGNTRVAAALPKLLKQGRIKAASLGKSAERALRTRGYIAAEGDAVTPSLLQAASAWRAVLDGQSSDLSACGAQTLDEWGGALLAALLGESPGRADDFKKLLRKSGVLAFGMRAAA